MTHDNCEEMGFRMAYRGLIQAKQLTTVFRPYNEKYVELYPIGHCVTGKIIAIPGNSHKNILPIYDDFSAQITIIDIREIKIGELAEADFDGSSPDVHSKETLKWHLSIIYNEPIEKFDDATKVVMIKLRYEK